MSPSGTSLSTTAWAGPRSQPIPTDPEAPDAGIRYRFGAFPFLEPAEIAASALFATRNVEPNVEDNAWYYNPAQQTRSGAMRCGRRFRTRWASARVTGGGGPSTYANNLDPDSYFRICREDRELQLQAARREADAGLRTCEKYAGQAVSVRRQSHRMPRGLGDAPDLRDRSDRQAALMASEDRQRRLLIPKRVLYIDSEGWFITASDQYDLQGKLWKTIATFNTFR